MCFNKLFMMFLIFFIVEGKIWHTVYNSRDTGDCDQVKKCNETFTICNNGSELCNCWEDMISCLSKINTCYSKNEKINECLGQNCDPKQCEFPGDTFEVFGTLMIIFFWAPMALITIWIVESTCMKLIRRENQFISLENQGDYEHV